MPAVSTMVLLVQLCWAGHVRMPDGRLPRTSCMVNCPVLPTNKGETTKIQGCSTQESQESQHHPFSMGRPGPWPHTVEECHQERCVHCWDGAQGGGRGKAQKAPQQSSCPCCLTRPPLPAKYVINSAYQRSVCAATPECTVQTLLSEISTNQNIPQNPSTISRNHHHFMGWIGTVMSTCSPEKGSRYSSGITPTDRWCCWLSWMFFVTPPVELRNFNAFRQKWL